MERIRIAAATLLLGALVGCGGGGVDPAGSDPGGALSADKVSQPTGSAPGKQPAGADCGLEHVWVTVERVRFNGDSGTDDITLSSPQRIDLVGLQGGLLAALGVAPLAPGHHYALHLVLSSNGPSGAADALANAVQAAGATPSPLSTPSGAQSGIKIALGLDVAPGQLGDLDLQFDACSSVVQAGNFGRYVLKPTLSARLLTSGFVAEPARVVNTTIAGDQYDPHVAGLADGGYAIVWSQGLWTTGVSTYGQRFDAMGRRIGSERQLFDGGSVDGITGLRNAGAAIVLRTPGASFKAPSVLALHLDNALAPTGPARLVITGGEPQRPSEAYGNDIDALPDGGFLVTAQYHDPRPHQFSEYYVRRFDASGQAASAPLRLPAARGEQFLWPASTSVLVDGSWVTAWTELFCRLGPCNNIQTFARFFNSAATPIGSVNINTDPSSSEVDPATAALRSGAYVLAWRVAAEVQVQLFDQNGGATSPVTRVDTPENVYLGAPQLTALSGAGFLLSATKAGGVGDDPSTRTVMGQYFDAAGRAAGPLFPLGNARIPSSDWNRRSRGWSVSALPNGGFVFTSVLSSAGSGEDIYQRRFVPSSI